MTPGLRRAGRGRGARRMRLAFVYVPNGINMPDWTPTRTAGTAYAFTRILKPLEPFRDDLLVLQRPGAPQRATRSATAPATTRARGGLLPDRRPPARRRPAPTSSRRLGRPDRRPGSAAATRLPSLELGCEESRRSATATPATAAPTPTASPGARPTTPMPPETNPRLVFERLFGDVRHRPDPATRARRARSARASSTWSASARRELMGRARHRRPPQARRVPHAVREVEQRIQRAETDTRTGRAGDREAGRHPGDLRRAR